MFDESPAIAKFSKRKRPSRYHFLPWVWYMTNLSYLHLDLQPSIALKLKDPLLPQQLQINFSTHPFSDTSHVDEPLALLHDGQSLWLLANLSHISVLQTFLDAIPLEHHIHAKLLVVTIEKDTEIVEHANLPPLGIHPDDDLEKVIQTLSFNKIYKSIKDLGKGLSIAVREDPEMEHFDLLIKNLDRIVQSSDIDTICSFLVSLLNQNPMIQNLPESTGFTRSK